MLTYCAYQGCTNKNVPCSSITFFTLPKDHRRQIWIENSGNIQLRGIGPNSVRYFCEKHFDPVYLKRQFTRTILQKTAVPYKYDDRSSNRVLNVKAENRDIPEISDNYSLHNLNEELHNETEEQDIDSEEAIEVIQESESLDEQNADDEFDQVEYVSPSLLDESYEKEQDFVNGQKRNLNFECDTNNDETEPQVILVEGARSNSSKRTKTEFPDDKHIKRRLLSTPPEGNGNYTSMASSSSDYVEKSSVSSSSMDYEEDKHFALSLVGYFQRLPMKKKAVAKLKILQYLTQIQYDDEVNL